MTWTPDTARREPTLGLALGAVPYLTVVALPLLALVLFLNPREALAHLRSPMALRALALTLRTTAIATVVCAIVGVPMALLLARRRFRGRTLLDTIVDLPLAVPPVVAGVALLLTFGRFGLVGKHLDALGIRIGFSSAAVVMAQVFMACPFLVRSARAGFAAVDPRLEQAARTLGAGEGRVIATVTLPLAFPSLAAGLVLTWARALSEFGATITFAGNFPGRTQTLPLAVMSALETDLPTAVATSVFSLVLAAGALLLTRMLARRANLPEF
jgi:molybdate transport system permease protein